jgi:predicted phage terminase large subunit-like protein
MPSNVKRKLDVETILGFQGALLSSRYDKPQPTPDFHLELWEECVSEDPFVAIAAPRGHAKSTAVTLAYVLCNAIFKVSSNILIISDTEGQAKQFLNDIKVELTENDLLKQAFKVCPLLKDTESELICEIGNEGHMFRVTARGSGQSLRGTKWRGKRPDLIIGDDMENDEMVMSDTQRDKFKKWFLATVIPMLSDDGLIRVVGTILHDDGFLENRMKSKSWRTRKFEAHNDDFTEILWPEKFPEEKLRALMAAFKEDGEYEIYLQEYRNIPIDDSVAYFRSSDFRPLDEAGFKEPLEYYVGLDCAISKKQAADYTAFVIIGVNNANKIKVAEVLKGRWDSLEIVDELFNLELKYRPNMFVVEDENISKAIGPFIYKEMEERNIYPMIDTLRPSKDLKTRARSFQARMRAGNVQWDKEADWYDDAHMELKSFDRGRNDDVVSGCALLGLKLQSIWGADLNQKPDDWDYDDEFDERDMYEDEDDYGDNGMCEATGY